MRRLLLTLVVLFGAALPAWPQPAVRIHTRPTTPSKDVLGRLGLTVAWKAKLPVDGLRDGFRSLQLLPGKGSAQLAVQTFGGVLTLLDAENGDSLWRTQVGYPYWPSQPVGWNDTNIFAVRRNKLYVLNRASGLQRVYTVDKDSGVQTFGFTLVSAPSAAPVADDEMLLFSMGNRVAGYEIPNWDAAEKIVKGPEGQSLSAEQRQAILEKLATLQPTQRWVYLDPEVAIEHPPLLFSSQLSVSTTSGHVLSLNKYERFLRFDFQTHGPMVAAMGQHNITAYVGSTDQALYALSMNDEKIFWRFLAGAAILIKPEVTDRDVFVSPHKRGLFRVDRESGREVWLNKDAERYLANNEKFTYAVDRTGRLLVIDYLRGTTLAALDTRDWILNVPNELTDRIYLASHDGQILCLRHTDLTAPLRNKTFLEVKKKIAPEKKEEKKEEEKKDEEKKDVMGAATGSPGATPLWRSCRLSPSGAFAAVTRDRRKQGIPVAGNIGPRRWA